MGVSVVLRLSFRTLGCRSSDRKHQSNRTKGTGRTKSTYKRLKELGFHSSLLHISPGAQFIHIRIFYKDRKCPSNYPNPKAYSKSLVRFWCIPPLASPSKRLPHLVPSALQLAQGGPAKGTVCLYCSVRFRLFVTQRQKGITCTTRACQVKMKVSC